MGGLGGVTQPDHSDLTSHLGPLLVTGGAGFIGTHFCRRLQAAGRPYVVLDLHEPAPDLRPTRVVIGDVRNPRAVDLAMDGCTEVLHLAAAHHDSGIAEETYFAVNVDGTENVLSAMKRYGVGRICFFSSAAIYGETVDPATETTTPRPTSPYGKSKLQSEQLLVDAAHHDDLSVLVIRPSVTFGEGNFANMYALIQQIANRRYIHVGPSQNRKSLSYVRNLVDFVWWVWPLHREGFDVYNWVESPDLTSRQIASLLADFAGVRLPSFGIPLWLALVAAMPFELSSRMLGVRTAISRTRVRKLVVDQTQFDSSKARERGFSAPVSLEDGLRAMVVWCRSLSGGTSPASHIPPFEIQYDVSVRS